MKREKFMGYLLILVALFVLIGMIVSKFIASLHFWFFIDVAVILVCGIIGIILIER